MKSVDSAPRDIALPSEGRRDGSRRADLSLLLTTVPKNCVCVGGGGTSEAGHLLQPPVVPTDVHWEEKYPPPSEHSWIY